MIFYEKFAVRNYIENMPHSFVRTPQPESHAAIQMIKEFIATQVNSR